MEDGDLLTTFKCIVGSAMPQRAPFDLDCTPSAWIVAKLSRVNRQFRRVASHDDLWHILFLNDLPGLASSAAGASWRDRYIRMVRGVRSVRFDISGQFDLPFGASFFRAWMSPSSKTSCSVRVATNSLPLFPVNGLDGDSDLAVLSFAVTLEKTANFPELTAAFKTFCQALFEGPVLQRIDARRHEPETEATLSAVVQLSPLEKSRHIRGAPRAGHVNDPLERLALQRRRTRWQSILNFGTTLYPSYKLLRKLVATEEREGGGKRLSFEAKFNAIRWDTIMREFKTDWLESFELPVEYIGGTILERPFMLEIDKHVHGIRAVIVAHSGGGSVVYRFEKPNTIVRWLMGRFDKGAVFATGGPPPVFNFEDGTTTLECAAAVTEAEALMQQYRQEKADSKSYESFTDQVTVQYQKDLDQYSDRDEPI